MTIIYRKMIYIFLTLIITVSNSYAAELTTGVMPFQGSNVQYLKIKGSIEEGDAIKFDDIIYSLGVKRKYIQLVILESWGGDMFEVDQIADIVWQYYLPTVVLPKQNCVGGCINIFAAGYRRMLFQDSVIGVHRLSLAGEDKATSDWINKEQSTTLKELNVPDSIISKMVATPFKKMYYLSTEEKKQFTTDKRFLTTQ